MVQGINTQNYSVAQLKELKNAGVQGISDDDIKAAEKREAEEVKESDDNAEVSYAVEDDASKENEAANEVKAAEDSGKTLCNILETLIDKCGSQEEDLEKVQTELSKYELKMGNVIKQENKLESETSDKLEEVEDDAEKISQAIKDKQNEIKQKEDEITALQAEIDSNPEDEGVEKKQSKIDSLQGDVDNLNAEISVLKNDGTAESKAEDMVKVAANVKLQLLGKTMDDVKGNLTDAVNKATNASEYADVTIEKGIEATESKPGDFISKTKGAKTDTDKKREFRNFIDSIFRKSKMNRLGNTAIAKGEHLGNSSVDVGKTVKQLGSQYSVAFAESSNIEALTSKEYVDTSKMDEMKDPSKEKGFFKKFKAAIDNKKIMDDVAAAAKEKHKKTEEPKTET